ncbi:MAG TPA: DUF4349 domain-containing protein [Thermoanaerobaculia bacterium]|jgi:hypothetical protein|nr:DUF4349 domain-containing protein [Thermoanaerobaculia bacterium]
MRYAKTLAAVLFLLGLGLWIQGRRAAHQRLLAGIGQPSSFSLAVAPPPKQNAQREAPKATDAAAGGRQKDEGSAGSARAAAASVPSDRRLIRSAELSIELDHYDGGVRRAEEIADSLGGFVADARSTSSAGERASGTLSLRVPADRFGEALRRLSELGRVRARAIQTQDVSREYFDLETRVRVKRDAEERMREVLRNRPARLTDIVAAEQELTRIVEEIETMEGQHRFYDRQVAMATLSVTLFEPGVAPPPAVEQSFLEPVRQALRDASRALSSSLAGLIYVAAVGLPWAALGVLAWMLARRVRTRRLARAS